MQDLVPCMHARWLQLCLTLCAPMDCNLPGSSIHGILQARILDRVAISSSSKSSQAWDQTHVSYVSCIGKKVLYHQHHLRSFPGTSDGKESACNARDQGLIPGWGRSPGGGNSNPHQYACLENSMEEESGGLQTMGSRRVSHDWASNTFAGSLTRDQIQASCIKSEVS